jgi:hypothetical protein
LITDSLATAGNGGEVVVKKFLHVGMEDATKSGVGGGHASKGNDCGSI